MNSDTTTAAGSRPRARLAGRWWRIAAVGVIGLSSASIADDASAQPDRFATQADDAAFLDATGPAGWIAPGEPVDVSMVLGNVPSDAVVRATLFRPQTTVESIVSDAAPTGVRHVWPAEPVGGRTSIDLELPTAPVPGQSLPGPIDEVGLHTVRIDLLTPAGVVASDDVTFVPDVGAGLEIAFVVDFAADTTIEPDGARQLDADDAASLTNTIDFLARHPDLSVAIDTTGDTLAALDASEDPLVAAAARRMQRAFADRTVLATPASDVSPDALADADLVALLQVLVDIGRRDVARLDVDVDPSIWVAGPALGPGGASALAAVGVETVLVDVSNVEDDTIPDRGTPAVIRGGAGANALVIDPFLGTQLTATGTDAEPGAGSDPTDDAWRRLATMLLRFDDAERTTVTALLGGFTPADPTVDTLFDRIATSARAIEVVPIRDLARRRPVGAVELTPLPIAPLDQIAGRVTDVAVRLESFDQLVVGDAAVVDDVRDQVAAAVSRGRNERQRRASLAVVDDVVDRLFASVQLGDQTTVNLSSRRGTIPVTVRSDAGEVLRVLIRVRSDRLRFPNGDEITVTVDESVRVDVDVEALATGSVPTFVEVWTPDGQVLLASQQLNVRSTAVSGVGFVLIAGALAVLVLWWVRHWRRTGSTTPDGPDPGVDADGGVVTADNVD